VQSDASALCGRAALLATVDSRLAAGGGVALHGPAGIGKTVLLDAVAAAAIVAGDLVPRLRPAESESRLPYAGIADLVGQLPGAGRGRAFPPAQRAALAALRQGLPPRAGTPALARRLVLPLLLGRCARQRPVLVVIDDAHWLDAESAELIGFAMRRRPGPRVRVIAAQRRPDPAGRHRAARLCPAPVTELEVPALAADDLTALLEARGLPCRTASRLHEASGGNPFLALALGGAVGPGPAWRPALLPEPARALLLDRIRDAAARCNRHAAGGRARDRADHHGSGSGRSRGRRPRPAAGRRGRGRRGGRRGDPVHSAGAGRGAGRGGRRRRAGRHSTTRWPPPRWTRPRRSGIGRCAVGGRIRAWPDHWPPRPGARPSAEPGVPPPSCSCWRPTDAHRRWPPTGWTGWSRPPGRPPPRAPPALAGRAAEAVLAADSPAGHRVRARLVLIDLAGQALADMSEMFAAALIEAGDDPALLAPVRLRLAWAAMLAGDGDVAAVEAGRAISAARRAGDPGTEAMALTALAQVQRLRYEPQWTATLTQALGLPAPEVPGLLNQGPRYMAARFAMVDDRLDEARAELLRLLAVAEQDRSGEALVEVLRSLSEVATRAGRCRDALRYAHRAVAAAQQAGLSPGPTWYTAAVAELAGGSLAAAAGYARRGVRASEQEGDGIFLRRNLHALGLAQLRAGDTRAGVAALRRLRELEASFGAGDPMIVRWHGDLAGGLAALGEHEEAADILAEARSAAKRFGATPGVTGYLDRAAAIVLSESGQADTAVLLSTAAALHFQQLHQPIEQAHALLVQGGAERRRRRYAAARVAIGAALAIFLQADAKPWTEQTERALARTEGTSAPGPAAPDLGLTSTEARIAGLVRDGASNREIATHLYLSVKTVEATLTRVYRKLGIRSRTQLSLRLAALDAGASAATSEA
jgi:DNA-binding CsgD family transcriptional regulator/tetratricopeptide (TPR) repeat protein